MIKAGCPEFICKKCGKAREKIYKETGKNIVYGGYGSKTAVEQGVSKTSTLLTKCVPVKEFKGYSDCGCFKSGESSIVNKEHYEPGIVLDIFAGSGTTGAVAKKFGRDYLLMEQNGEYIEMIEKRLEFLI